MARREWFTHDPMTTCEAEELLSRYKSRGVQATKTLSFDPRLWLVSALLPYSDKEPRSSGRYQSNIWS